MIVTVMSFKGGVAKTTSAIHLAAYLQKRGSTLLLDGDRRKFATNWAERGDGLPFRVESIEAAAMLARDYEHIVINSGQLHSEQDLAAAAKSSHLLIIPVMPSALDVDGLSQTIRALKEMKRTNYRVLLTKVAPDETRQAAELREKLAEPKVNAPVFSTSIPQLKAFKKAADLGEIVSQTKDVQAARAWAAYVDVGKEMVTA